MNMTSTIGEAEWGKEGREFRLWVEQGDTKKSRFWRDRMERGNSEEKSADVDDMDVIDIIVLKNPPPVVMNNQGNHQANNQLRRGLAG